MSKTMKVKNNKTSKEEMSGIIQNFLEDLCIKDKRSISETTHKFYMLAHFYYVDDNNQGWYVLDDPSSFYRDLSDTDYWIYAEIWENAVAWE